MRIGVIADIHSNIRALEVVLKKFDELKVDKILLLGDSIGMGLNPEEVVKLLIEHKDKIIGVNGNHEDYYFNGFPEIIHGNRSLTDDEKATHSWNHSKLSEESISYLSNLNRDYTLEINNKKIYMTHYYMGEDNKYLLTEEDYHKAVDKIDADVYLYGHTHKKHYEKYGNKLIINPGSLGCPKHSNAALAGLLIIDNTISYVQLSLDYDIDAAINDILLSEMPMKERMIKAQYRKEGV